MVSDQLQLAKDEFWALTGTPDGSVLAPSAGTQSRFCSLVYRCLKTLKLPKFAQCPVGVRGSLVRSAYLFGISRLDRRTAFLAIKMRVGRVGQVPNVQRPPVFTNFRRDVFTAFRAWFKGRSNSILPSSSPVVPATVPDPSFLNQAGFKANWEPRDLTAFVEIDRTKPKPVRSRNCVTH